jgi:hypothetical protein
MSTANISDDDEYPDLAEDPDLAFRQLEKKFRGEMNEALNDLDREQSGDICYLSYINRTIAAAKTLAIETFKDWEIPSHERNSLWGEYQEFNTAIEHYLVQVQIMHSRRVRGYSVQLDASTKSKIRHYLEKIREIVDRLEVPLPKKEALTAKITALSDEVDRDRTRFDAYAGLALEVAATGGEMAQKLNPLRKFLDSIAGLLGYAKQAEDARPSLPAPHERKRLTAPRRERLTPSPEQPRLPDLDEDIPF